MSTKQERPELQFTYAEARAIYDAGFMAGLDRYKDDDSFEDVLIELGKLDKGAPCCRICGPFLMTCCPAFVGCGHHDLRDTTLAPGDV